MTMHARLSRRVPKDGRPVIGRRIRKFSVYLFAKLKTRACPFLHHPRSFFPSLSKNDWRQIESFYGPRKHLFIENNIRVGVSMISNRYAKANNKYTEDGLTDEPPNSFLRYLDANNLYGIRCPNPFPPETFASCPKAKSKTWTSTTSPTIVPRGTS